MGRRTFCSSVIPNYCLKELGDWFNPIYTGDYCQALPSLTRSHPPMQERNLAGRQDISEDPGTSKFEGSDVQTRRISQQDL